MVVGALACGLVLLLSATRSHRLAEETVRESQGSVTLFQGLQAARIAGSGYMEDGEREDLVEFRAAARQVDAHSDGRSSTTPTSGRACAGSSRDWHAAVRQLRGTPTGVSAPTDDAEDPEDVFEAHINEAIGGVETLVDSSERETRRDVAAAAA